MPEVMILSLDSHLLRETSWWLSAFGFHVRAVRTLGPLAEAWNFAPPALLLVDAVHPEAEQASAIRKLTSDGYMYTMAMCDSATGLAKIDALLAAFDDVVHKPLNCGETIARLRAGLRYREFERRAAEQSTYDLATGLATQRGLLCAMERLAETATEDMGGFVLVVLNLDGFDVLERSHGAAGRDAALRQTVEIIVETMPETALAARLREGEFAVLLPNSSPDDAEAMAARIKSRLADLDRVSDAQAPRFTVTLCTAEWTAAVDEPKELLRTAVKTLRQARNLGGDMTARNGEFDQAFKLWQQKAATIAGALINLTAGDVMTPFTACWVEAAAGADLRAAIFNSGALFVPYLDEQENYIGVLRRVAFEHPDLRSLRGSVETPLPAPEDLQFSELAELMMSGEEELLVVVRDGRPLGYITCEALANMLNAANDDDYRCAGPVGEGPKHLIVAESAASA